MSSSICPPVWTVSITGVSGSERIKGSLGVGKSLICNRFVRPHHDDFYLDHSSTLSQTDFSGSPVINNDHWLYWGERVLEADPSSGQTTLVRVIEQTEFVDDETFEPIPGPSYEPYEKRCGRTKLESRDKLMYIRQEQLGTEADFPQRILPDGKTNVDSYIFVFDCSTVARRNYEKHTDYAATILHQLLKWKRGVVIAASKFDAADDNGRLALNRLLARKSLRDIPVVQVSALRGVNVDELFAVAIRPKARMRVRPYEIALKNVDIAHRETRSAYISLLHALVSTDGWPSQRTPWSRLVGEMGMSRNPSFLEFLRVFGMSAARATFEAHVQEVREKCMKARLRALLPSLPSAFSALLDRSDAIHLEWMEARERIYDHALFDAYFLPLGTLGRLLEPVSSEEDLSRPDARFPAEILLRPEARQEFEMWRDSIGSEMRREKLEEEAERFLGSCPQVTPGRPLAEVKMLLAGSSSVLDALTPAQLGNVYDRFQGDLIARAEMELAECLLEHVETFVELIVAKRDLSPPATVTTPVVLSNNDMDHLRTVLQEDVRYRQLSGVRERREWMVREWAAFLSLPFSARCPAIMKCIDTLAADTVEAFMQRRRELEGEEVERIEMIVYGSHALTRMFCIEMHRSQMEGRLRLQHLLSIQLICREGWIEKGMDGETMRLFLVESQDRLAKYREALQDDIGSETAPPSLFLIACPEEDYHMIPLLQNDTATLAESVHGYLVSPRQGGESSSGSIESPSPFPPSHLLGVMENAIEIMELRRGFVRAQMSMMCSEGNSPESLLSSLLAPPSFRLLAYRSNLDSLPLISLLTQSGEVRVDLRLSSYHSWLCSRPRMPIHAHIVVYSAKRSSSWAHARAGVRRILEEGDDSITGRAILIVAIANDVTDYFRHEETNVLLTEGAELASSVGAQFIAIPGESGGGGGWDRQLRAFFERIQKTMPSGSGRRSRNCMLDRVGSVELASEYGVLLNREPSVRETWAESAAAAAASFATMAATAADAAKPAASVTTQRRRPVPPRLLYNRYSMMSGSSTGGSTIVPPSSSIHPPPPPAPTSHPILPPFGSKPLSSAPSSSSIAPLATPEPLDLAAEYSTVQDSGSSEDDYAQIGRRRSSEDKRYGSRDETSGKGIRLKMTASTTAPIAPPPPSPLTVRKSTAPPSVPAKSETSPAAARIHKKSTPASLYMLGAGLVTSTPSMSSSFHTGTLSARSGTSPIAPIQSVLSTHPLTSRSLTMDVINMEAVIAARKKMGMEERGRGGIRNSISSDSLNGGEGKKKNSFVRKIKSSFRKRGGRDSSMGGVEGEMRGGGGGRREGGASLPQSPALGAVRRLDQYRKNTTLPIVTVAAATPPVAGSSSDKGSTSWAQNSLAWLAGRSPHRKRKDSKQLREGSPMGLESMIMDDETNPNVPRFVANAIRLIEKEGGLSAEGIYRLSGSKSQQEELEQKLVMANPVYSSPVDVYSVAVALKNFFIRLPQPIIPFDLHSGMLAADENNETLRTILRALPDVNRDVLIYLFAHLNRVAESAPTAMNHTNLAIVWLPALLQPHFKNLDHFSNNVEPCKKIVRKLLEDWRSILPVDNNRLRSF